jgi:NAD(P)H-hydrate epimerase
LGTFYILVIHIVELNEPAPLPQRDVNGHKGTFGDVLFIAGAASYLGAPFYSAYSFLKTGGGYSRLAAPASITQYIAKKGGEIVFVPQEETSSGSIALNNKNMLLEISEQVDMVVMGPGLSLNEETQELARQLTTEINKPLLIDGDGITAVAQKPELLKQRKQITILTPHPGEMARLSGQPIKKIEQDKIGCLEQQTRRLNSIIVLKGAHSIIGYPDGRILINMSGNSGMASAGSGDVLTGIIAAMYGLGQPLEQGVPTGVFIHGFSGDLAAVEKGEDGITAQDLIDFLPMAIKNYRETHGDIVNSYFPKIT